ncbi:hypothetical protein [Lentzea sp. HUAS12]|uniref:hypothetical protein n=1 Tax=Lentzea sp. HUAS12 TaxID=2951806 RepID=UPI00209D0FE4|nr:hypothetical protein [Lentzea sp. HUAS12]USX54659.1 hypothetical protein ND450_11290 [Lentzea sp. HUAS12]
MATSCQAPLATCPAITGASTPARAGPSHSTEVVHVRVDRAPTATTAAATAEQIHALGSSAASTSPPRCRSATPNDCPDASAADSTIAATAAQHHTVAAVAAVRTAAYACAVRRERFGGAGTTNAPNASAPTVTVAAAFASVRTSPNASDVSLPGSLSPRAAYTSPAAQSTTTTTHDTEPTDASATVLSTFMHWRSGETPFRFPGNCRGVTEGTFVHSGSWPAGTRGNQPGRRRDL